MWRQKIFDFFVPPNWLHHMCTACWKQAVSRSYTTILFHRFLPRKRQKTPAFEKTSVMHTKGIWRREGRERVLQRVDTGSFSFLVLRKGKFFLTCVYVRVFWGGGGGGGWFKRNANIFARTSIMITHELAHLWYDHPQTRALSCEMSRVMYDESGYAHYRVWWSMIYQDCPRSRALSCDIITHELAPWMKLRTLSCVMIHDLSWLPTISRLIVWHDHPRTCVLSC